MFRLCQGLSPNAGHTAIDCVDEFFLIMWHPITAVVKLWLTQPFGRSCGVKPCPCRRRKMWNCQGSLPNDMFIRCLSSTVHGLSWGNHFLQSQCTFKEEWAGHKHTRDPIILVGYVTQTFSHFQMGYIPKAVLKTLGFLVQVTRHIGPLTTLQTVRTHCWLWNVSLLSAREV